MIALTKQDWPKLQWSVILFVALLAVGGGIIAVSGQALSSASKAHQQAKASKDSAHGRAARADEEAVELAKQIALYQTLQARGIIGQEHRLEWIETIRKIKQDRKLIDLDYELGPQSPIKTEVIAPGGNTFDIMASPMKLRMSLLHENDLLGLLSDLRSSIQGYIRVSSCDVSRVQGAATNAGPTPQLHAECELDWITLREKS